MKRAASKVKKIFLRSSLMFNRFYFKASCLSFTVFYFSERKYMSPEPFFIHLAGSWFPPQVQINYQAIEYVLPDDFVRRAAAFWERLLAEGQRRIFNGALCRLESFREHDGFLHLALSRTCYRDLMFSNAHAEELINNFGESGPARALGISAIIETVDGYLPLIRRSAHVGEAPGGLDVIGGHVHPDEHMRNDAPEVFLAIKDEIQSELGIPADRLDHIVCCGVAENRRHRKPELAFFVPLPLTMQEVQRLAKTAREAEEYAELFAVRAERAALQEFVAANHADLTPAALGCFHLYAGIKNWPLE